jgi:hypothetical protein
MRASREGGFYTSPARRPQLTPIEGPRCARNVALSHFAVEGFI